MKIGIELRQITLGAGGGLTLLVRGYLEALFARDRGCEFVVFATTDNRGLLDERTGRARIVTLPTDRFFEQVDRICREEEIDVLFRSYPMDAGLAFPLSRQIFLVPDIQHEVYPEFFSADVLRLRRSWFNQAVSRAGAVATISEYARGTLRAHAWTRCEDIFLMFPALLHESDARPLLADERALIPDGEFFLYPANLWPHKNHRRLLEAFKAFRARSGRPTTLILTGHTDGVGDLPISGLPVRHLGFVPSPVLRALIERARALLFFSLYEGFGMPLLEAFEAGTPVLCSNTTSLPEVGGDAVLACDPTDVGAMTDLMVRIVEDEELRERLVARGKERLRAYSWEWSAASLVAACERVLQRAREGGETAPPWTPLVSIVTPSFNQGRYLRRTIESVLGQTYPHIEYVVMDGGSTDESVEILRSYGDRFSWVSERDAGQADAINKGFARTGGEIRAYLNSDDVLTPDAVERIVQHFRREPDTDLVYGRAEYIDEEDRVTGHYNTAEYSFPRLMQDCCVCQPAAFWRKRIADRVGPFDASLHYVMDYEYWLRIDRAGGRIRHVPDLLAASRLYPETKTKSARTEIYREIFAVCQARGGYVDLNYFYGLWHHRIHERKGWASLLRVVPRAYERIAKLHHAWYHWRRSPSSGSLT